MAQEHCSKHTFSRASKISMLMLAKKVHWKIVTQCHVPHWPDHQVWNRRKNFDLPLILNWKTIAITGLCVCACVLESRRKNVFCCFGYSFFYVVILENVIFKAMIHFRYSDDALMEVISDCSLRKSRSSSVVCDELTSSCPCIEHLEKTSAVTAELHPLNSCLNANTPLLLNHVSTWSFESFKINLCV